MIKQKVSSHGADVTLLPFCRVSWIRSVVVVVAKENMELMVDISQRFRHTRVQVVAGGSTRHRSISNGVMSLAAEEGEDGPKVVIVHDAVRPFVEEDFLCKIAVAAKEHGVSVRAERMTSSRIFGLQEC